MIIAFKGMRPVIGPDVFIAPNATIIGDVKIESGASIWYGTVVRGDRSPIRIGRDTNIQDNTTIHTVPEHPVYIGARVSVGHNAVIHGCTVEDDCLIAIGAVLLDGSVVGEGSVVAAGSVVRQGQRVDSYRLVAGNPVQVKRELSASDVERFRRTATNYRTLALDHLAVYGHGAEPA